MEALIARSHLIRVACLDVNADGKIDAGDADGELLPDITGDGAVDDSDLGVIANTGLSLPGGRPPGCDEGQPEADWQVTRPAAVDCAAGQGGVIVVGVGGGIRDLSVPANAAGIRWILAGLEEALSAQGVPRQLASVAPGLGGTEQSQPDAEAWLETYLDVQLSREPCLRVALIGHSHGGALVSAVAAGLESAGLGDRILQVVLVDRITALYGGRSDAVPQTSPVLNIYQTNDEVLQGKPIERPNVENWDASRARGPEKGDQGGRLRRVNHVTIENSQDVLDRIEERIVEASCDAGLCSGQRPTSSARVGDPVWAGDAISGP